MSTEQTNSVAVIEAEPAKQESLPLARVQPPTPAEARDDAVAKLVGTALAQAGMLKLTPEESKALCAEFADDAFQPGAGGKENLIYIEHAALRDRLNQVLGLGQWVPVVRESWKEEWTTSKGDPAITVYSRVMLVVRGCYVGEAVGDMDYFPNNRSQNYGDAFEGAKTAGLRRCAKEFGVGLQAWRKDWCLGWWARRRDALKRPLSRPASQPPSTQAQPSKAPITPNGGAKQANVEPKPQNPALAGALKVQIDKLAQALGKKADYAVAYLRCWTADGSDAGAALMPNEGLDALSEHSVQLLREDWKGFLARLDSYIEDQGGLGPAVDAPKPASEDPDWFWDIILTVPPKGSKKAEYQKNPDTIRSLYDAMKGGDEVAQARLWGLAKNWNPAPHEWQGKTYQPTEADHKARKALDAFVEHEEKKQ